MMKVLLRIWGVRDSTLYGVLSTNCLYGVCRAGSPQVGIIVMAIQCMCSVAIARLIAACHSGCPHTVQLVCLDSTSVHIQYESSIGVIVAIVMVHHPQGYRQQGLQVLRGN